MNQFNSAYLLLDSMNIEFTRPGSGFGYKTKCCCNWRWVISRQSHSVQWVLN